MMMHHYPFIIADVPFSAIADTICLPATLLTPWMNGGRW